MTPSKYTRVARLAELIRNARYGEMVRYCEELIDSGDWRDFTTPTGTRFEFRSHEFDYFLAAVELDTTFIRHAYVHAQDIRNLEEKRLRLADITGRGRDTAAEERRAVVDVAKEYRKAPGGAGARIEKWHGDPVKAVVSRAVSRSARRKAAGVTEQPPREQSWRVRWSDDKSAADVIAEKLLEDDELAKKVFYKLKQRYGKGAPSSEQNRRSAA